MIVLRRATEEDRVAIARLHEASIRALGPAAYTAEEVDSWAAGVSPANYNLDQQVYVAVVDDTIIAFGQCDRGEIMAVYVDPRHVRRGIGRLVMEKIEEVARAGGATSLHLNAALGSRGFYEACGYHRTMETTYLTRGGLAIRIARMEKSL